MNPNRNFIESEKRQRKLVHESHVYLYSKSTVDGIMTFGFVKSVENVRVVYGLVQEVATLFEL